MLLLLPMVWLAAPAGASASDEVTLTTFANGQPSIAAAGTGCTASNVTLSVPWNATVTTATFDATLSLTSLAISVELNASWAHNGNVLAGNLTLLPGVAQGVWLPPVDIHYQQIALGQTSGSVNVSIAFDLCPALGAFSVTFDNLNLTYWLRDAGVLPPPLEPLPAVVSLSVNGALTQAVENGTGLTLAASGTGTILELFNITWYIDGSLSGYGTTLSGVDLGPGDHTIEMVVSNGTASRAFSSRLHVAPLPSNSPWGWLLPMSIGVAAVGAVVGGTQTGRWLVLGITGSVFTRLKRDSLLDHFVRGTLFQVIRENPGVHFAELRRRAQLSNGAASHHLRTLEKGGYVKVVIDGTKTRFYVTDRPLDKEVYGISDTDKAVLVAVTESPGIGQHDLTARVNKSAATVSRSVARLVTLGYVTTSKDGANVLVFPRPGAELIDPLAPAWPDEGK